MRPESRANRGKACRRENPRLPRQRGTVHFHRALGQAAASRDLLVEQSMRDTPQHLALAEVETFKPGG